MKIHYILFLSFLVIFTGCTSTVDCEMGNGVVCFDDRSDTYLLEKEHELLIAVPNEEFGLAVVKLWNETFPEYIDHINYEVVKDRSAIYYLNNPRYDLIYISEYELPLLMDKVLTVDENTFDSFKPYMVEKFAQVINEDEYRFVPIAYQGFLFAYDEELLTKAGLSLLDSDLDGLPDSIDTWEEIFERITYQANKFETLDIEEYLPIALNEKYSFYTVLTAGGWQMFEKNKADDPGFTTSAFKGSLRFVYELGKYDWSLNDDKDNDHSFRYEEVLSKQSALFTMVSPWMFYNEYEKLNKTNYRFSRMPSYNGHILEPLVDIDGYAISVDSECPNLAHQLLMLIRSELGLQRLIDETDLALVIEFNDESALNIIDQNKQDMIIAYKYSSEEPFLALSNDTTIRAWQMYYDIDLLSVIRDLFAHTITVSEAQAQINEMANEWLQERGEIK
ncbi:MAG: extracellular solute-binding protein [Erysipelotrichaceae bacterium]|nr:extracellular solute-binding protein [Erysipelotrichaceae bacterium]MDD3924598.1 extracellular solute-binding protein [Erysipelotrichaceae bacterium]MDD4642492.1 extracellular solute-binding protein [Erysipelotrichaceae bacterium]